MRKIVTAFILIFASLGAWAVTLPNLYTVNLPVTSRASKERDQLLPKAMQEVLVRISGNSQIMSIDNIGQAVKQANNYLRQYAYQRDRHQPNKPLFLTLSFEPQSIRQLLRQNGQPIWGANRPLILIWMSVDENGQASLVSGVQTPSVKAVLTTAKDRGLPMIFPLLDLNDLRTVSANTILQDNVLAIENASQRYSPDAIVMVNMTMAPSQPVTGTWRLLLNGQQQQWQVSGGTLQEAVQQGMNDVADTLAKQYAVLESQQQNQQAQIEVMGLSNIGDYARVERYLRGLTGVDDVEVANVGGVQAVFNLHLSGNVSALVSQIKLGRTLLPVHQDNLSLTQPQGLVYRYSR